MILCFTIPGEPSHAARARAVSIGGHARMYSPKQNVVSGKIIRDYALEAMNGAELIEGPVKMTIEASYLHPGSWSKKKCERTQWKTSKPDADNLYKLYADSFTGIIWRDDAQVAEVKVTKRYADKACTTISIEALT